jgi:hypothetical protein
MSEHDFEPIRGLPGDLPEGETILWQGAPDWRVLVGEAFHIRLVGAYFAAMLVWRVASALAGGGHLQGALATAAQVSPLAIAGLGILAFLAWLNSRTTVYTITNRRVVMRFGAAFSKAINIPFEVIDNAAVKTLSGGAGDLALSLKAPNKIALLMLWPHARPWKLSAPEPTLRAIPRAADAAKVLASAMQRQMAIAPRRATSPVRAAGALAPMPGAEAHAA